MPAMDATEFEKELVAYRKDWPEINIDLHSAIVGWNLRSTSPGLLESERVAIREETRAEILKNRFEIGEELIVEVRPGFEVRAVVEVRGYPNKTLVYGKIRRPQKMRQLTTEQMANALHKKWYPGDLSDGNFDAVRRLPESILRIMCARDDIPTEVEE